MFKLVTLKSGRYLLVLALLVSLAVSLTPGTAYASADKATICHKPGTAAEKTLEVSSSAVPAHLAHGDHTGACGPQVSAGCAAVNALVPDAQTDSYNYIFGVSALTFLPGEVLHADITIDPLYYQDGAGVRAQILSTSDELAAEYNDNYDTANAEALTASATYVVVAGDDADGLKVENIIENDPFTLVSVHFSCTPAG